MLKYSTTILSFVEVFNFGYFLLNTGIQENSTIHLAVESIAFLKLDTSITTC